MKHLVRIISLLTAMVLAACGGSDKGATLAPPPPPPPATEFTTFVKDQFAATSDTTVPVNVDDENLAFSDDDNAAAFDDLLQ